MGKQCDLLPLRQQELLHLCNSRSVLTNGCWMSHWKSQQHTARQKHISNGIEERGPVEPLIFHTDRGSNYHSKTFRTLLPSLGNTHSFSRAHIPYDNSVIESFFSNLKREELYRTKYRSENEFRTVIGTYMVFYNEQRPHAKNGYKTLFKKEQNFLNKQAAFELKSN